MKNVSVLTYSPRSLYRFLLVTLGLVALAGAVAVIFRIQTGSPAYYALYLVGLCSPFLGALTYLRDTTGSVRTLRSLFVPWQWGAGWGMIGLVPLASVLAFGVAGWLGWPLQWSLLPPVSSLLLAFAGWSSVIWLEEVAWRGTLLPVLQQRFSPLTSTVLVNLVWVAWHLPLLHLIGMTGGEMGMFAIQTMGMALSMAWAYNRSHSVVVATLIHGAYNATTGWLLTTIPSMSANELIGISASGQIALGALVAVLSRGRLGARAKNEPVVYPE